MKRGFTVFSLLLLLVLACNLPMGVSQAATPTPSPTPSSTVVTPPAAAIPALKVPPDLGGGGTTGWLTYTNNAYGFLLQYPAGGGGLVSGATDTMARIQLPITHGTNLSEKFLDINVQLGPGICQSPEAEGYTPGYLTPVDLTINGLKWVQENFGQGAAGSMYQSSAYSTTSGVVCVSLTFVLHSHNPGAVNPSPPLFNQAQESAVFPEIVNTFQWLHGGSASTPTQTPWATSTPSPTLMGFIHPVGTLLPFFPTLAPTPTPTPRLIFKLPFPIVPIFPRTSTPTPLRIQ